MFFNDFSTFQFNLFWDIRFYWKANIPENSKNGIKEFGRETVSVALPEQALPKKTFTKKLYVHNFFVFEKKEIAAFNKNKIHWY